MHPQVNVGSNFQKKNSLLYGILFIALILLGVFALESGWFRPAPKKITAKPEERFSVAQSPVFDYNHLQTDDAVKETMEDRKAKYNIEKGVDMIVRPDETVKINDKTIRIRDIIDKAKIASGEIVENDLVQSGKGPLPEPLEYGIYVVHPKDNIWSIHFNFLKDYFRKKGVTLGASEDRPRADGSSSGIGKILKFSEKMVYIYNINEKKIDTDIHTIQPLSKIVVYNMKEIFELLEQIDYNQVNQIRFDGETLWLPPAGSPEPNDSPEKISDQPAVEIKEGPAPEKE